MSTHVAALGFLPWSSALRYKRVRRTSRHGAVGLAASLERWDADSIPSLAQWVKGLVLLQPQCRLQGPWPENFNAVGQPKEKKGEKKDRRRRPLAAGQALLVTVPPLTLRARGSSECFYLLGLLSGASSGPGRSWEVELLPLAGESTIVPVTQDSMSLAGWAPLGRVASSGVLSPWAARLRPPWQRAALPCDLHSHHNVASPSP